MVRPSLLLALAFGWTLSCGGVMASDASLPAHRQDRHDAAAAKAVAAHRAVARHAAEVAQLKRSVAAQEARSRQASLRLREQDWALERLHRELQAAGVPSESVATGP